MIKDIFVANQFLTDIRDPQALLKCFKVVIPEEDSSVTLATLLNDENYYNTNIKPGVANQQCIYCMTHIEDDIISVKLNWDKLSDRVHLYFVYDYYERSSENYPYSIDSNRLAFAINIKDSYTDQGNTTIESLENYAENYIQLSLKSLLPVVDENDYSKVVSCSFDTFDNISDDSLNPEITTQDTSVTRQYPVDHSHMTGNLTQNMIEQISFTQLIDNNRLACMDIVNNTRGSYQLSNNQATFQVDGNVCVDTSGTLYPNYNPDFIKTLGVSYLFKNNLSLATGEDNLFLIEGEEY